MFHELDCERSFNIIDDIWVEETVRNSNGDVTLHEARVKLDKIYSELSEEEMEPGYIPGNYIQPDENGFFAGLGPALSA